MLDGRQAGMRGNSNEGLRRQAGGIRNRRIRVDEREVEPFRQPAADRRLARAHQAHEDYRSVKAVCQLSHEEGLYSARAGRQKRSRFLFN